jgi:hypothetical protein
MITQKILKKYVDYDPLTGVFTWKYRKKCDYTSDVQWRLWNRKFAGNKVVIPFNNRHLYMQIQGVKYNAAYLAVLFVTGEYPKKVRFALDGQKSYVFNNLIVNNTKLKLKKETTGKRKVQFVPIDRSESWNLFVDGEIFKTGRLIDLLAIRKTIAV